MDRLRLRRSGAVGALGGHESVSSHSSLTSSYSRRALTGRRQSSTQRRGPRSRAPEAGHPAPLVAAGVGAHLVQHPGVGLRFGLKRSASEGHSSVRRAASAVRRPVVSSRRRASVIATACPASTSYHGRARSKTPAAIVGTSACSFSSRSLRDRSASHPLGGPSRRSRVSVRSARRGPRTAGRRDPASSAAGEGSSGRRGRPRGARRRSARRRGLDSAVRRRARQGVTLSAPTRWDLMETTRP